MVLGDDPRFLAAWLGGSFGRGDGDDWSDLDLWVVVDDAFVDSLCATPYPSGSSSVPSRLELISAFGRPAVAYEHHANAPVGGSFTTCIYAESGVTVDWVLVPAAAAVRGQDTRLLFDRVGILVSTNDEPDPARLVKRLSERYAFFWMMVVPVTKAWHRGDSVRFHILFEVLHQVVAEVEAGLRSSTLQYRGRSRAALLPTQHEQIEALRTLAIRARNLRPEVLHFGGSVPPDVESVMTNWLGIQTCENTLNS